MVSHPQRVRHDRERRIHRAARWEEATIHHVEIVHLMSSAVRVQGRRGWIRAEAHGAVLMRHAGKRNPLPHEEVPGEESLMTLAPMQRAAGLLLHEGLELGD